MWNFGNYTNAWKLNDMLLNNQQVNEEIKKENLNFLETNENRNTTYQNVWDTAKTMLSGEFYNTKCLHKKDRKISN